MIWSYSFLPLYCCLATSLIPIDARSSTHNEELTGSASDPVQRLVISSFSVSLQVLLSARQSAHVLSADIHREVFHEHNAHSYSLEEL
jgi:hypothetical protein